MKLILSSLFIILSSFIFSQTGNNNYYEMFYFKDVKLENGKISKEETIEYNPTREFLIEENITKCDTIALLSYMSKQIVDSLNKLRFSLGLKEIINYEDEEDEYGFAEKSIFHYSEMKKNPLMVKDYNVDFCNCKCYKEIIEGISTYKGIMRKVLSKRNKELFVSVMFDFNKNEYYINIQVRRLFTFNYFI
jgi:hypothetical protein